MAKSIFLCGTDHQAGMSIVTLGLYRALSAHAERLLYFKPIGDGARDPDVAMIKAAHHLEPDEQDLCAVDRDAANRLMAQRHEKQLLDRIAAAYGEIAGDDALILVEGISSQHNLLDIDFNKNIAARLESPVLLVTRGDECGDDCDVDEVATNVMAAKNSFEKENIPVIGVLVNRVKSHLAEKLRAPLEKALAGAEIPVFGLIPELASLAFPVLDQIALELNAEVLTGGEHLGETVTDILLAAMEPRNFLKFVKKKKTLVITPGDREDILLTLACLQSAPSRRSVSGVLLTGGIHPPGEILDLIHDMKAPAFPIMRVDTDSFTTAARVQRVDVRIRPKDHEKINTAVTSGASHIDAGGLWRALNLPTAARRRSKAEQFLSDLIEQARAAKRHIVLPEGDEPRTLKAVAKILRFNLGRVTLLGNEGRIREKLRENGIEANDQLTVADPAHFGRLDEYAAELVEIRKGKRGGMTLDVARDWLLDSTVNFGTMMVKLGDADGLVSGAVHSTADTIRPALQVIRIKTGVDVASSVFFMVLKDRILIYGDCAIVPNPNANELASIAISSARTARAFGVEPRVALLSYSTGSSGAGEAVDKVKEALNLVRETNPDFPIDGPLQYDAAIDPDVGHLKLPDSPVAGLANVFIFPDLNAGNIAYKAVQRSAGALAVGPVLQGLNKPVNDLSRGCSVDDIVYTVAVTAIQAAKDSAAA